MQSVAQEMQRRDPRPPQQTKISLHPRSDRLVIRISEARGPFCNPRQRRSWSPSVFSIPAWRELVGAMGKGSRRICSSHPRAAYSKTMLTQNTRFRGMFWGGAAPIGPLGFLGCPAHRPLRRLEAKQSLVAGHRPNPVERNEIGRGCCRGPRIAGEIQTDGAGVTIALKPEFVGRPCHRRGGRTWGKSPLCD